MLETGNWLVPYVGGEPYLRKPPMINWLVALSFTITGHQDEFSARLPSVLAVLFLALGMYGCSRRWLGEDHAFFASIALLTTISLMDKGRMIEIEAVYIAAFGLGLLFWIHFRDASIWARWLVPAIPLGFALLVKGPVHLLFYYGIVGLVLWREKRLKEFLSFAHLLGVFLIVGIFAIWAIPHLQTPEAYEAARTWSNQFSGRLVLSKFHWKDWLFNYPQALSNFLPWILLVPFSRRTEKEEQSLLFGLEVGTLITFMIVMLAPGSLPRYSMPLLVPVCLLAAHRLKRMPQLQIGWRYGVIGAVILLSLAIVVGFFLRSDRIYLAVAAVLSIGFFVWWRCLAGQFDVCSLTRSSGIVIIAAICFYCGAVIPVRLDREVLRPRAAALAKLVPEGEPIYAINPGSQQIFFYLRKPWHYVVNWEKLPADARYLLVSRCDLPELTKRFDAKAQRVFAYRDRGEKELYLYRIAG